MIAIADINGLNVSELMYWYINTCDLSSIEKKV